MIASGLSGRPYQDYIWPSGPEPLPKRRNLGPCVLSTLSFTQPPA